jgi:hypothetical protein
MGSQVSEHAGFYEFPFLLELLLLWTVRHSIGGALHPERNRQQTLEPPSVLQSISFSVDLKTSYLVFLK